LSGAVVGAAVVLGCIKAPELWSAAVGGAENAAGARTAPLPARSGDEAGVTDATRTGHAARLGTLLEGNARLRRTNPLGARDQLRMLLAASPLVPPQSDARRRVFDQLGETYAQLRNHTEAHAAHAQSHAIVEGWARSEHAKTGGVNRRLVNEMIISQVQLATDLYLMGKFDEALKLSGTAMQLQPPPGANRVLLKLEATIFECKGDFVSALQRLEEALKNVDGYNTDDVKRHLELLKRVTSDPAVPAKIREMMTAEQRRLAHLLLTHGGFESEHQLPRHFHPGLTAQPWHTVATTPDPAVPKAVALLQRVHQELVAEFHVLNDTDKLLGEQECIHDPSTGQWRRYEVTGEWRPLNASTGCSVETPTACAVLRDLRALGLRVVRAGYSAVQPSAWLKPHFGMSNGQLKLHLGLVVPTDANGAQCATMRVHNFTRGWTEGDVLYFDDSFEHEVKNRCSRERVVFQVVFVHFDLDGDASARTVFQTSRLD
jgi:tetratricopeptide (TPR) repeat protein